MASSFAATQLHVCRRDGSSPFDIALRHGHTEVATYLDQVLAARGKRPVAIVASDVGHGIDKTSSTTLARRLLHDSKEIVDGVGPKKPLYAQVCVGRGFASAVLFLDKNPAFESLKRE